MANSDAKPNNRRKRTDPAQFERFIEAARKRGINKSLEDFAAKFSQDRASGDLIEPRSATPQLTGDRWLIAVGASSMAIILLSCFDQFCCGLSGINNAFVFVIHFAAPKQIIQAADAIPTIAIPLDDQPMSALLVGAAVIVGQEIDQQPSGCGGLP
jgi:hypothetical protein